MNFLFASKEQLWHTSTSLPLDIFFPSDYIAGRNVLLRIHTPKMDQPPDQCHNFSGQIANGRDASMGGFCFAQEELVHHSDHYSPLLF